MNNAASEQFILDMVKKGLEDIGSVFQNLHKLIHIGGGDCRDASFVQMIVTEIAFKAMDKNIGEENRANLDALFEQANEDFQKAVASQEAEIQKMFEEQKQEFIKNILAKVFGVTPEEIVMEETDIGPIPATRH